MSDQIPPAELAALRRQLEHDQQNWRAQIEAIEARRNGELSVVGAAEPLDLEDIGAVISALDRDQILEVEAQRRLAEIERALAKMDAGTYGLCELCGQPIALKRLRVVPEARYDIQHQAAQEARPGALARA